MGESERDAFSHTKIGQIKRGYPPSNESGHPQIHGALQDQLPELHNKNTRTPDRHYLRNFFGLKLFSDRNIVHWCDYVVTAIMSVLCLAVTFQVW